MANSNFVVQNGLTVGGFVVNATTSNITLPVTKQLAIGNVILRDNGDGKLHIRDITDNSDAELIGTVGAVSTTSGNIQIGTNHIESTNPNGPISLRPNGNGNIAFSSNTIMIGHGGAFTLVGTGIQTEAFYGINYPATNIVVTLSAINSSGNLRLAMTTASTSTTTGALQVPGGVGVGGAVVAGQLNTTGNILGTGAVLNALTVNGNITVASAYAVPSANAASSLGSSATRWNFVYGVTGNFLSVNANYADLAEKYLADAEYTSGTVLMFGGEQEVTECTHDMCSRVAGVVSTNPAYLMNSGLEGEHTVELALTGRVPTRVRGPIRKGDLMVSAGDGHARAENLPRIGTVIGKALEDFTGDTGVIEVVIGKH